MNHTLQCSGYFGKLTQAEDTRIEQDTLLSEHTAIEQRVQTSLYGPDFLQCLCAQWKNIIILI